MNGMQCDNCRAFTATIAPSWLILQQVSSEPGLFTRTGLEMAGTFCSVRCLAEWSYVQSVSVTGGETPDGV